MFRGQYEREAAAPDISVVIATIPSNDHERVCRRLEDQTFRGDWEILVVDDSSIDRCEARNEGLREANSEIVAFTDDDTEPPRAWLGSIWTAFSRNPDLVCLEGRVTGGIRYSGVGQYVGCNMAVDRRAAIAAGGWDSEFAGWREDTEFGWRLEEDGDGVCQYYDDVRMVHPGHPRTSYDHTNERLLGERYPARYSRRIDASVTSRLWRYGQRLGIVPYVNRIRDTLPSR